MNGCNDADEELMKIKMILKRIGADGVLQNPLDRADAEAWA